MNNTLIEEKRKNILVKKYNCRQNISEHEFCKSKGWYRIYDCGCLCYKWKKVIIKQECYESTKNK